MIVDSHTHILPLEITNNLSKYSREDSTLNELFSPRSRTSTAEELINSMDKFGIEVSVIMGMGWTDHSLNTYVNDYLLESAIKYPRRLIPATGIIPTSDSKGIYEAERCIKKGAQGIGEVHLTNQKVALDDFVTMAPFMQLTSDRDLPMIVHCSEPVGHIYPGKGTTFPNVIEKFVMNFPQAKIVLAHWGAGLPFYLLMPEIKKSFSNVYFDTAATNLLYNEKIFQIVETIVGYNKILFGSDYPLIEPSLILNQLNESNFNSNAKNQITSLNTLKVFSGTTENWDQNESFS